MVRETVDAMREHCPNPNKAVCSEIVKSIVMQYPKTFGDLTEEGEPLGSGYHSLFTKIKTRVDHKNHNRTLDRIRRPKGNNEEERDISGQARTKVDSYSCINWQPQDLPEKETPDKRQTMATIFSCVGPRGADDNSDLQGQWLFLFIKLWLCDHFNTLTGIEIDSHLTQALLNKGNTLLGSSKWMVSIEGRVVCVLDSESNFAAALSVLFSTFYVFNIEFQELSSATLELIRRFLVPINPEGTKCTPKEGESRKTGKVVQRKPQDRKGCSEEANAN
ncbi:unnamed protein product [Coregonus sp. 'balchen']|nr:unnamed protein product [Coregonus sp. 'balchen']